MTAGAAPSRQPRGHPEAALQRQVVLTLRLILPTGSIVHHSAHEVGAGGRAGRTRQAIAIGMGVHPGFPDLVVLSGGRVLFLELKSPSGRLGPAQAAFRDAVRAQGFGWALARSLEEALEAVSAAGMSCRVARL